MRAWVLLAAINGLVGVAFAAWGAHGLAGQAVAAPLVDRASQFQLVHALAMLAADRLAAEAGPAGRAGRLAHLAAALFLAGIVLFSGSLYVRALLGPLPLPLVTPAGGIAFMLGWVALGASAFRGRRI